MTHEVASKVRQVLTVAGYISLSIALSSTTDYVAKPLLSQSVRMIHEPFTRFAVGSIVSLHDV